MAKKSIAKSIPAASQSPINTAGSAWAACRWGVDVNGDGVIDGWQQISAEEVSQEVLRAVATRNLARLQALVLSERELKALELSPTETARIHESIAKIPAQFQATCTKLSKLNETVKWQHLESQPPQAVPSELAGGKYDLVRYTSATILYQMGEKDHDWLQTGEMVQVGHSWRIVSGPMPGHAAGPSTSVTDAGSIDFSDETLKGLIEKLQDVDKSAGRMTGIRRMLSVTTWNGPRCSSRSSPE